MRIISVYNQHQGQLNLLSLRGKQNEYWPVRLAGAETERVHLYRVAGNTVWQVTLRSSDIGFLRKAVPFNH